MKYTLALLCLVTSISVAAELERFQVTPGDSLSYILRSQNYGQTYVEVLPFFDEVMRLNPQAFRDDNPNYLLPDAVLTLPANPNAVEPVVEPEAEAEPEPETIAQAEAEPELLPEPEPVAPVVGSIEVARGFSEIIRGAEVVTVTRREDLLATDVIFTQANTRADIRLNDETRISLGPESRLEINEFSYSDNQSQDSLIVTLHRGAFAIITGLLAQNKSGQVEFRSALSTTIGIRGTDFTVRSCMEQAVCGGLYGVAAAVRDGAVGMRNDIAEILLNKNEFARVTSTTEAPAKAPLPKGFYDLDLAAGEIKLSSSWWQRALDWITSYF